MRRTLFITSQAEVIDSIGTPRGVYVKSYLKRMRYVFMKWFSNPRLAIVIYSVSINESLDLLNKFLTVYYISLVYLIW